MIPYEDLCRTLDIYNRKLRGEDVPEEAYQPEQALDDEFDIVDEEAAAVDMEQQYAEANPDVTAETAIPDADFGGQQQAGSGEYAEGGYDSGAVPGQPADGMTSDQYSSGQVQQAHEQPAEQQYQEGYEQPAEQQYQEGYEQPAEQPPGIPDDQDPNQQ